ALLKAVDVALAAVLGDGVELQTYNVHATGHGHDTAAAVTLSLRPRSGDPHAPAYPGRGVHENILEASLVAYVDAINRLVAHGKLDVESVAPGPDATSVPTRTDEADTPERHGERFMEMFNH
ncbi:MAG: alpha-isopropylmalate synthase regulatory domain-containing protein, partial [Candidatus Limnocylindria bacterium]